ncbi:hypothetical protein VNI00_008097 [Paramarasmius palmivorus]|uniref:F-box domain-containing protein n=1 Tax=Paramarasmius palmivorus TaxID=297713 RepID=A0AAW0CZV0_9AGAR
MLTLPPELLNAIVYELSSLEDKKNLRITSKYLNLVVGPHLFSNITIDVKRNGLGPSVSLLKVFTTRGCRATSYVKKLTIKSLGPTMELPIARGLDGIIRPQMLTQEELDAKVVAFDDMKELLPRMLSLFVNLTTVDWTIPHHDPEWSHALVINTISTHPSLSNLSLEFVWNYHKPHASPLNLTPFRNLKSFSLKGSFRDLEDNVLRPLRGLLKNNADLSSLSLNFTKSALSSSADLDQFITSWSPKSLAKSKLKHLRLGLFQGNLTPSSISHLRSLTSLELLDVRMVFSNIWDALHQENIYLREISVPAVNDSFLRYISSYSGIRKLHYHSLGAPIEVVDNSMADMLYDQVLPRHAETLEDLALHSSFEGRWSVGERNLGALQSCTELRSLGLSINRSNSGGVDTGAVDSVLHHASSQTYLRQLNLRYALFVGPRPTNTKPTELSRALIFDFTKQIEEAVLGFACQQRESRGLQVAVHDSNYEGVYEARADTIGVLRFAVVDGLTY